jgi:YVTN family beta-propeller protein
MKRVTMFIRGGAVVLAVGAACTALAAKNVPTDDGQHLFSSEGPVAAEGIIPAGTRLPVPWQGHAAQRDDLPTRHLSNGLDPEADLPRAITFSPDGQYILIAHDASRNIVVFDADTLSVVRTVALSGHPFDVAVSSNGTHAITANAWDDTASIVDYTTGAELAVLPVGDQPTMALISPDGGYAAIGNMVDETWSIIDMTTQTVTHTVSGGGYFDISWGANIEGIFFQTYKPVILPDNRLVLGDFANGQVTFTNLATAAQQTISVASYGKFTAATPAGDLVLVLHNPVPDPLSITLIDPATMSIVRTIPFTSSLFESPVNMIVRPDGSKMAFFHGITSTVIFDLLDDTASPIQTFIYGNGLTSNAAGDYLFINRTTCSSLIDWDTGQPVFFTGTGPEFCAESPIEIHSTNYTAASPTDPRIAMIASAGAENLAVFNTDGAAAHVEGVVPSGPEPEGDRARNGAVSADGSVAVVINQYSLNATVYDLTDDSVRGFASIGRDPRGVAITPDNAKAVVTYEGDTAFVTVIDLNTLAVTNVHTSGLTGPLAIDALGQYAYIARETSQGQVARLDLSTLTLDATELNTALTGCEEFRMLGLYVDSGWGQPYDMPISHDGATLCVVGEDEKVTLIDTATWTVQKTLTLPVSTDFVASRAVFSPDDAYVYVGAWHFAGGSGSVHRITNNGTLSTVDATYNVGAEISDMVINSTGTLLYITCREANKVAVLDTAAGTVTNIPLPDPGAIEPSEPTGLALTPDDATLYVMSNDGSLYTIDTATNAITASQAVVISSYNFIHNVPTQQLIIVSATPYQDGLTIIELNPLDCPWDTDGSGSVGTPDFFALLQNWGDCPADPDPCPWDFDDDASVGVSDFFALLQHWGPCD